MRPCLQWGCMSCPSSEQRAQHCHNFPIHPTAVLRHEGLNANSMRSYAKKNKKNKKKSLQETASASMETLRSTDLGSECKSGTVP